MSAVNGTAERKKVAYLGLPCYGELTVGAARGFFRASAGRLDLRLNAGQSSLLAQNMNILWCWALNAAHAGERVDFFAMLHADVEPEEFWLDKLTEEMEARGLDVLGVVAPIKDVRGVTSTALAREDGSTWRVQCRLTMKEIYRLPETFTSEDVGAPLLINTGCWVCRFSEAWAKKVHFEINDRIGYVPAKKMYMPETEPEDWYISRLFHELKLRVGVTRKVTLGHRGTMVFGNDKPWGQNEFDKEYLSASVLPAKIAGDWFPYDADGWLSETEGRALAKLAAGKFVLEIGSFCGRSTVCLAQEAKRVHCVDPFDARSTDHAGESTLEKFLANLTRYNVAERVTFDVGTAADVVPGLPPESFDLAFIDGAHDRQSVEADVRLALSVLRPGGLLAFHDYRTYAGECDGRWDAGVTAAVDALLAGGAQLLSRFDSLAVVRPVAAPVASQPETPELVGV